MARDHTKEIEIVNNNEFVDEVAKRAKETLEFYEGQKKEYEEGGFVHESMRSVVMNNSATDNVEEAIESALNQASAELSMQQYAEAISLAGGEKAIKDLVAQKLKQ